MKKFILITGASGGIGKAIALRLAEEGYSLYLHYYRNERAIKDLLHQLKEYLGEYIPIQANLAVPDGYKKVAAEIFDIEGIIHNSGSSQYGLLVDLQDHEADELIALNVKTPLLLTKELLPKLIRKQKGNIVVISSIWGQTGAACEVAYSTVKGAQLAFVKALSKEVALNGIRVNAIAPGIIQTEMIKQFNENELEMIKAEIPAGKLGTPENIADGVSFLLSEKSTYMTGQVLAINGGWYI
jgi:3-oxoacyl-[acyl-carrier protein] reductase